MRTFTSSSSQRKRQQWLLLSILLVGAVVAVVHTFRLESLSVWGDEVTTLGLANLKEPLDVWRGAVGDVHPPGYFWGLHYWLGVFGGGEIGARAFSILWVLLTLPVMVGLENEVGLDPKFALLSAAVFGLSPMVVLYGNMLRYYSLTAFCGVLATWLLLRWLRLGSRVSWVGYVVSIVILPWVNYLVLSLLPVHFLLVVLDSQVRMQRMRLLAKWLQAVVLMFGAGIPVWLGLWNQLQANAVAADRQLPAVASQGIFGMTLGLGFTAYSFSVGQNILPWNEPWVIVVVVSAIALVLFGAISELKLSLMIFLPSLSCALAIVSLVPYKQSLTYPMVLLFLLPFWLIAMVAGIQWLIRSRRPRWAMILITLVIGTNVYGLVNYFQGKQYLIWTFGVPTRQIAASLRSEWQSGDLVVSDDTSLAFYLHDMPLVFAPYDTRQMQPVYEALQSERPERVWVYRSTSESSASQTDSAVAELLSSFQGTYHLTRQTRFVEDTSSALWLKSLIKSHESQMYKKLLELYERSLGEPGRECCLLQ